MISWHDSDRLAVGERVFEIIDARPAGRHAGTTAIRKSPWVVRRYLELIDALAPRRVVELGIDRGGSTVFFALVLTDLERLLALDIDDVPDALTSFVADHPRGDLVSALGGVDQSDSAAVTAALDAAFGADAIDLVIDDASHLLGPTRVSFDLCFPRLRPGGVLVIEDWSWEHKVGRAIADRLSTGDIDLPADAPEPGTHTMPLSRLVLEAVLAAAQAPEVVADVRLRQGWVEIERGPAALDRARFSILDHVGWTGERVLDQTFTLP